MGEEKVQGRAGLVFRPAGQNDVAAVVSLVNSAYRGASSRRGWTTEADLLDGQRTDAAEIAGLIAAPGSIILLCLDDGVLAGSVHLRRDGDGAYLGMLVIDPVRQGVGLGKRLMAEAESRVGREWGCVRMWMTVITLRHELIAFYGRRGYRRTGRIVPFPVGEARFGLPKVDGLEMEVLEKHLGPGQAEGSGMCP